MNEATNPVDGTSVQGDPDGHEHSAHSPQRERAIVDVLHPDRFGHPVVVSGTIDAETGENVLHALLFASLPGETLLVDLSRVHTIDDAGLTVLSTVRRQARRIGGDMIIAGLPDEFDTLLVDFTTDDDLRLL